MAAAGDELDRMAHVDGLRAVAVLAVVLSHAAKYSLDLRSPLFHPLFEGTHGVDLFFVISGFCLSYPTLARLRRTGAARFSVSGFFAKRALRIYPPYWFAFAAALISTLALARAGYQPPWPTIALPHPAEALRQWFLVQNGHELVGSFWTLAVELRWYVVFPLLLWLWTRSPVVFALAGAASFTVYHAGVSHLLDFATLPAFMLGIVAADLSLRRPRGLGALCAVLAVLSGYLAVRVEPAHLAYVVTDQVGWQFCAFFFVVAACDLTPLRRALAWRPLVIVGLASYSIYLFHDPVMAWYGKYGGADPALNAIAGIAVGLLAWLVFERPYMDSAFRARALGLVRAWVSGDQRRPAPAGLRAGVELAR